MGFCGLERRSQKSDSLLCIACCHFHKYPQPSVILNMFLCKLFCLEILADSHIRIDTSCWELMRSVGSNGSYSLPSWLKMMVSVSELVSGTKVMITHSCSVCFGIAWTDLFFFCSKCTGVVSAISWKCILQPLVGAIDDLAAQGSVKE